MNVTILHNPKCSTSRTVLAMIREAGHEPQIVEYLKHPPTRQELVRILVAQEMEPRQLMRRKEAIYKELKLDDENLSDNQLLDAMMGNPILIERPVVITEKGVRLCRPKELVQEIL
ncbi:arsenate reductase (glutaredoxin) [Rhizobium sp. L1K21]|uniref:arsenate reductase (glutaredoxin) n=1 Tax=Rhizobium sp. L1K21 TaxID=2954933 RepID=UPI0020924950|nr:arsenate reductase (glutaredoxin) [Rhizobium sp. L1K21]MCO6186276.1 arsenate reductase (glutaredoxin) [Rhizobium sp. L1K21]